MESFFVESLGLNWARMILGVKKACFLSSIGKSSKSPSFPRILAFVESLHKCARKFSQGMMFRTPRSKNITYLQTFQNMCFWQKLRLSRVILRKCPPLPRLLRSQESLKITKNTSQGILFIVVFDRGVLILSCQGVRFPPMVLCICCAQALCGAGRV